MGILDKLDFILPPTFLQNQFAAFVEQVEKQKAVMQQSLEKMEMNYRVIILLIKKKFKGKFGIMVQKFSFLRQLQG